MEGSHAPTGRLGGAPGPWMVLSTRRRAMRASVAPPTPQPPCECRGRQHGRCRQGLRGHGPRACRDVLDVWVGVQSFAINWRSETGSAPWGSPSSTYIGHNPKERATVSRSCGAQGSPHFRLPSLPVLRSPPMGLTRVTVEQPPPQGQMPDGLGNPPPGMERGDSRRGA